MSMTAQIKDLFDHVKYGSDVLRIFLLGFGAILQGLIIKIVASYFAIPNRDRSRILVWHTIIIGLSFSVAVFLLSVHTIGNANQLLSWWFWSKLLCFALGIVGLWAMMLHLSYERRAIKNIRSPFKRCHQCGSHYVDKFCCRCGADQRTDKK